MLHANATGLWSVSGGDTQQTTGSAKQALLKAADREHKSRVHRGRKLRRDDRRERVSAGLRKRMALQRSGSAFARRDRSAADTRRGMRHAQPPRAAKDAGRELPSQVQDGRLDPVGPKLVPPPSRPRSCARTQTAPPSPTPVLASSSSRQSLNLYRRSFSRDLGKVATDADEESADTIDGCIQP
jgi:hypothetical protein